MSATFDAWAKSLSHAWASRPWGRAGRQPEVLRDGQHYGVTVIPARPRKPKDKAKIEGRRAHRAALDRGGAAQSHPSFTLAELNAAIRTHALAYLLRMPLPAKDDYGPLARLRFRLLLALTLFPHASLHRRVFDELHHLWRLSRELREEHVHLVRDLTMRSELLLAGVPFLQGRLVGRW